MNIGRSRKCAKRCIVTAISTDRLKFSGIRWHCDDRNHDDVIKWKHFPRYWPFVRGIHRGPVNSPHKAQWRGALMFSLISARINSWVNNGEAGDLGRNRANYDVIVMGLTLKGLTHKHTHTHIHKGRCNYTNNMMSEQIVWTLSGVFIMVLRISVT